MGTWDACELLGDHLREFTEFLDYERFRKDLVSLNGSATGGIRMCHGHAIWYDDPAKSEIADLAGDISFGFGRVDQASDLYADTEYRTPTGRYYERAQLRRDLHEDKSVAERSEDGPWDEATVLLGDTGTGTTLSAFILDAERDFMLELSVSLDGASSRARLADELTWTLEEAAKHFREVTMRNAYQEMVDRIDAVS